MCTVHCHVLRGMTKQQFEAIFERLTPRRREVLLKFLANESDEAIANSLHIRKATVRKHIEEICKAFSLTNDFSDERRSKRQDLVALFAKYKPELLGGCASVVENEGAIAHPHQDGEEAAKGLAIKLEGAASNNPNLLEPQVGENLMSLATKMLAQVGFNQKFKVSRAFKYVGYRLKNAEKEANPHQLILSQRKDGLCISIRQDILDPHLLNLKYWEYTDVLAEADLFTKARFLVLPSKKDIFLESLHPNYWNSLQAEEKTVGDSELNTCTLVELDDYFWEEAQGFAPRPLMCEAVPSILLDEFNPDTLSDTDTYLVVNYDKLFPGTWQVFISSREVLEEFLSHFAKILMEEQ